MIKLIIVALIFIISCSSDNEQHAPYIHDNIPDAYYCEFDACGPYPELMKCADGTPAQEINCLFVEGFGCKWVGSNCKDKGIK